MPSPQFILTSFMFLSQLLALHWLIFHLMSQLLLIAFLSAQTLISRIQISPDKFACKMSISKVSPITVCSFEI
jgi:hypothetical protein